MLNNLRGKNFFKREKLKKKKGGGGKLTLGQKKDLGLFFFCPILEKIKIFQRKTFPKFRNPPAFFKVVGSPLKGGGGDFSPKNRGLIWGLFFLYFFLYFPQGFIKVEGEGGGSFWRKKKNYFFLFFLSSIYIFLY